MKKILLGVGATAFVGMSVVLTSLMTSNPLRGNSACLGTGSSCFEEVDVEVTIEAGDICIGYSGGFDFGTFTTKAESQTVTGSFTNPLWVEDLRGADSGYYTTLQLSGDLVSGDGNIIPARNVRVRAGNAGSVTKIGGNDNTRVVIDGQMKSTFKTLENARTFIERTDAPNFGLVGKYGNTPDMQMVIPAYTPVGTYSATMVYTLYEDNTATSNDTSDQTANGTALDETTSNPNS